MENRRPQGFTIIELLVVLAIGSIIFLIAIPIYQTYRVRAQISEGISLVRPIRQAAAEYYMLNGAWPSDNAIVDLKPADEYETHYVKSIALHSEGENASVTITYKLPALGEDNTLILFTEIKNGHITWYCTAGSVLDKYRPRACRKDEG